MHPDSIRPYEGAVISFKCFAARAVHGGPILRVDQLEVNCLIGSPRCNWDRGFGTNVRARSLRVAYLIRNPRYSNPRPSGFVSNSHSV